ncbi:hypothetical protein DPMN_063416 [Dreissena polymorpha]|uniref:Uncharacterized protein n=1 Tax=Dreissena polymorpha TaxID=45954 RepID=A0A9D4CB88_DREPO|nr:hypothetical protein DPMN_063416 [Dreissena polymorpha]
MLAAGRWVRKNIDRQQEENAADPAQPIFQCWAHGKQIQLKKQAQNYFLTIQTSQMLKMHHDDYKGVTCGCDFNHDDVLVVYNDNTYDDDDADAVIVVDNDEFMEYNGKQIQLKKQAQSVSNQNVYHDRIMPSTFLPYGLHVADADQSESALQLMMFSPLST